MSINESNLNIAWSLIDGEGLVRVFPVGTFQEAVEFIEKLVPLVEERSHDPDVRLSYQKVIVTLYSHDVQDVTDRDYAFAQSIDQLIA